MTVLRGCAQVAELVDALVSGTSAARRGGSSPFLGTSDIEQRSYFGKAFFHFSLEFSTLHLATTRSCADAHDC